MVFFRFDILCSVSVKVILQFVCSSHSSHIEEHMVRVSPNADELWQTKHIHNMYSNVVNQCFR